MGTGRSVQGGRSSRAIPSGLGPVLGVRPRSAAHGGRMAALISGWPLDRGGVHRHLARRGSMTEVIPECRHGRSPG
jgi:hypothetical protein